MAKKKATKKASTKKITKKNDKTPWLILAIVLIVVGSFLLARRQVMAPTAPKVQTSLSLQPEMHIGFDFGNQKFMIDNQVLQPAQIQYNTVNPANTRGAAILVNNPGGSGTFYYIIGAMRKNNQQIFGTPILIGDRIKVLSIAIDNPQAHDNGIITVKYLDRPTDAPMATEPSIPVTKKYAFQEDGNLTEIIQ